MISSPLKHPSASLVRPPLLSRSDLILAKTAPHTALVERIRTPVRQPSPGIALVHGRLVMLTGMPAIVLSVLGRGAERVAGVGMRRLWHTKNKHIPLFPLRIEQLYREIVKQLYFLKKSRSISSVDPPQHM